MAFLDTLSNIAKNAADKTSDMMEISKLNSKINDSKNKIASCKMQIGEYYWEKYENGEVLDKETMELCDAIKAENGVIEGYNNDIRKIKADPPQPDSLQESVPCSSCGQLIHKDKKFCPECGTPVNA